MTSSNFAFDTFNLPYEADPREEFLPFTIRVVGSESALRKAIDIRHSAYARHVPALAATMVKPEAYDAEPGTVVLLAESRLDGEPLGTMRIQTNEFKPLAMESSVDLPASLRRSSMATAARLGIAQGRVGPPVKTALFKAFYTYCMANGIDNMVIAARRPLDRMYTALMFQDIFPEAGFIPLSHAQGIPHRILVLEVDAVKRNWAAANHALYDYFFRTIHPDISVSTENVVSVPAQHVAPEMTHMA